MIILNSTCDSHGELRKAGSFRSWGKTCCTIVISNLGRRKRAANCSARCTPKRHGGSDCSFARRAGLKKKTAPCGAVSFISQSPGSELVRRTQRVGAADLRLEQRVFALAVDVQRIAL